MPESTVKPTKIEPVNVYDKFNRVFCCGITADTKELYVFDFGKKKSHVIKRIEDSNEYLISRPKGNVECKFDINHAFVIETDDVVKLDKKLRGEKGECVYYDGGTKDGWYTLKFGPL